MGKRERRLAAMSNASRRVKLGLFAEPSGDLGCSDVGDRDEREQTDPNDTQFTFFFSFKSFVGGFLLRTSHSGQKTENPLLFLGQYSDDEPKISVKRDNAAAVDSSLAHNKEQTINEKRTSMDSCASDVMGEKDGGEVTASDYIASVGLHNQPNSSMQASNTVSSELHVTGDVSSYWELILHEESNQYYYWNIETGETSWEVPEVLAQTSGVSYDQKTYATGLARPDHFDTPGFVWVQLSSKCGTKPVSTCPKYYLGT